MLVLDPTGCTIDRPRWSKLQLRIFETLRIAAQRSPEPAL